MTRYYNQNPDGSVSLVRTDEDYTGNTSSDFGVMKRRIERLEREQSLQGKRIEALEARLRAENTEPIPGDVGFDWQAYWDMLDDQLLENQPKEDDPR